jgi:ribosome-associated protein
MSETKPRSTDVQKLQRAIVDGLEDVKGQDIVVFDTEHLSPLFERVIIASGTSNRQTKALAISISDAVREAGFPKPRMEGEGNGEWIIVDCGAAVAHVMQPNIRQYYHLEEIWGGKTVRLKLVGDVKKFEGESSAKPAKKTVRKAPAAEAEQPVAKKVARKAAAPKAAAPKAATAKASTSKVKPAAKTTKSATATKSAAVKPEAKAVKIKTLVVGQPTAKKTTARAATGKPPVARKAPARKSAG